MEQLPQGYCESEVVDLANPSGYQATIRRCSGSLSCLAVLFLTWNGVLSDWKEPLWVRLALLVGVIFAISLLLTGARGVMLKLLSKETPRFHYKRLALYPGVNAYFSKKAYFLVLLLPFLVIFVAVGLLALAAASSWRGLLITILTFSALCSFENVCLALYLLRKPRDILIRDSEGVVTVFAKPMVQSA